MITNTSNFNDLQGFRLDGNNELHLGSRTSLGASTTLEVNAGLSDRTSSCSHRLIGCHSHEPQGHLKAESVARSSRSSKRSIAQSEALESHSPLKTFLQQFHSFSVNQSSRNDSYPSASDTATTLATSSPATVELPPSLSSFQIPQSAVSQIVSASPSICVEAGTLSADTFTYLPGYDYTVFSGNGNVNFGQGGRDLIDLSNLSFDSTKLELASATSGVIFNPNKAKVAQRAKNVLLHFKSLLCQAFSNLTG